MLADNVGYGDIGAYGAGKGGTGALSVNGKKVGEGRIAKTVPVMFSTDDTFDVGEDWQWRRPTSLRSSSPAH
ncbi:MAG: hypothetical protein ACHBNF_09345 [Chromatiales bacterium]